MDVGNLLRSLSPEVQTVLVVCVFALAIVFLMMMFLIISSRAKTRNLSETLRELGHLRDRKPPNKNLNKRKHLDGGCSGVLAGARGLEPPTSRFGDGRSAN